MEEEESPPSQDQPGLGVKISLRSLRGVVVRRNAEESGTRKRTRRCGRICNTNIIFFQKRVRDG